MTLTLGDVVLRNGQQLQDTVATIFDGERLTYGAYSVRCQKLASALAARGVRRQDRIAVLSRNNTRYLDVFGAAQLAGFIVATVNFRLAVPEIGFILADAQPAVVFFEALYARQIDALREALPSVKHYVCLDGDLPWAQAHDDFLGAGSADGAPFKAEADDVLHLIYTSGTTGRPKGVMRTHAAELAFANMMTTEVGVSRSDVVQIMMPLFHVGARWLQLGASLRGATVVLLKEFEPAEVLATIDRYRVTLTHMAPTIIQRVLDHPDVDAYDLSSLKTIYYSAAPMPPPLLQRGLAKLGSIFVQLYGMTEGAGTTLHKGDHVVEGTPAQLERVRSVGHAGDGVELRIVDDDERDLPAGSPGEVLTRTSTRMLGYWNNSAATIDALRDGWYRSGDMGYLDERGFLFLVDRKKDMIITGGENVYCREVENAIASHPGVDDVAVIGVPDPVWGENVCAVVVCKPGHALDQADIVDHCRELLASYKKPKLVEFRNELPRLTTGKVDKKALRNS